MSVMSLEPSDFYQMPWSYDGDCSKSLLHRQPFLRSRRRRGKSVIATSFWCRATSEGRPRSEFFPDQKFISGTLCLVDVAKLCTTNIIAYNVPYHPNRARFPANSAGTFPLHPPDTSGFHSIPFSNALKNNIIIF